MRAFPALALALAIAGCSRGGGEKLVVYSAGPRPLAESACQSFTKKTGVPVELFSATTGQIMAKLEAERFNPRADVVVLAGLTPTLGLKARGRLHPYAPTGLGTGRTGWNDPDHTFHATGAAAVGIAFREGANPPALTWRGVLLGELGPRVAMPSPSRSGTSGDFLLTYAQAHPDTFWADFKSARHHGLQIVGANSQAITGLLTGAYDAVYAAADYIICREIDKGEKLSIRFPAEGAPYVLRPIAILAASKRIPLAEKFVDHFFSDEVQRKVAANHLLPALESVPLSPIRARFAVPNPLPFNGPEALAAQQELVRKFQYDIERAVLP